jgi:hypothetical protein
MSSAGRRQRKDSPIGELKFKFGVLYVWRSRQTARCMSDRYERLVKVACKSWPRHAEKKNYLSFRFWIAAHVVQSS